MKFRLGNNLLIIRNPVQRLRLPFLSTWGITNHTGNGWFTPLDYDKVDYDVVQDDVRMLQDDFNEGHALVRMSRLYNYKDTEVGSYHVYFFTLHRYLSEVLKLVRKTRCDDSFKRGYKYQARCLVLRVGEKLDSYNHPTRPFTLYKELILQKHDGRCKQACNALINMFEKIDNIELKKHFKKIDDSKELEFIRYMTR